MAENSSRSEADRILDLAIRGREGLDLAFDEVVTRRADEVPEIRDWLRDVLASAREALAGGDSDGSVGALAEAAESTLRGDVLELAAALCGLAVNFSSELEQNGQGVAPVDAANLRNVTGLLAFHLGRLDVAQRLFEDARELAAQAGDPAMGASALLNLCNVARLLGDASAARQLADEAEQLYVGAGDRRGEFQLRLTLANMAIDDDDFDEAASRLAALDGVVRFRQPDLTASFHHARGRVLAHERRWDEAEKAMQASLRAARRAHHSDHELATLQSLAALASDRGEVELARRRAKAAVSLARERRVTRRLLLLLPSYISGELKAGHVEEAIEAGHELLELASSSGHGVADAQFLLGSAELESGNAASALERFESAQERLAVAPGDQRMSSLAADIFHNTVLAYVALGKVREHAASLGKRARDLPDRPGALEHLAFALSREQAWQEATRLLLEAFAMRPAGERAWAGLVASHQLEGRRSPGPRTALLRSAVGVAEQQQQHTLAIRVRNDLALARIDDGDLSEGLALLEVNLRVAHNMRDGVMRQQALYNIAETRRRLENLDGAERDARAALELAEGLEDPGNVASSLVQLAQILGEADRSDESRPLLERAFDLSLPNTTARAAAISGLAGLTVAEDPAAAADLYEQSLDLRDFGTVNHLENLIYLSQALAATDRRRAYTRRLQEIVDESVDTPLNFHMAFGMGRIAATWSSAGKPKYAGETLALMVLIWLRQSADDADLDDRESALYEALSAAAYELHRETEEGEPSARTRAALEKELRRHHLDNESVSFLMHLLEVAGEPFRAVPQIEPSAIDP